MTRRAIAETLLDELVDIEDTRARTTLPIVSNEASPSKLANAELERCGADDRFHDYVLLEYQPVASPVAKLRSLNLLVESFALAGVEREGLAVMHAVRDALGPFRTVWGIKWHHARRELGWELYFYDYQREHADLSIANLGKILAPHVTVGGREPRPLPWHMFSIEFDRAQLCEGKPSAVDIYVDMRSYKSLGHEFVFENVYTFHHAYAEIDEILHRIRACTHFDPELDRLHRLVPPHLLNCRKVCVANKRSADALYFSRVTTRALQRFLVEQRWPAELAGYVEGWSDQLNHLLWDVGIDYRSDFDNTEVKPIKTGIYGSF